ncbi:MAG: AAA family ATPase, partial [Campylobacterales bacterium]|nr:AAA family ATPase [Campylobacterales bacterium]
HINGLLQAKIKNKQFYGRINTFVYFHNATTDELKKFYQDIIEHYQNLQNQYNEEFRLKRIEHDEYEKQINYVKSKLNKINRDLKYCAIARDSLRQIKLPNPNQNLFTEEVYNEFKRILQPPYHTLNEGIEIRYTPEQEKLIVSSVSHQKIIGVAGSGKTVVLAKRAVNAHKRHGEHVLILTFNITLKSYIHDRISDVRENFSWGIFHISNYHNFIVQSLNNLGIEMSIPEETNEYIEEYFDKNYFSNIKLFRQHVSELPKYKTILIDEIQDYKSSWIKILRDCFCEDESEIVLFGDEKQNIYHRVDDENNTTRLDNTRTPVIIQGFGKWQKLTKPIRYPFRSVILPLIEEFQSNFLQDKYEIEKYERPKATQNTLIEDVSQVLFKFSIYRKNQPNLIAQQIIEAMKENNIHNDDMVILGSKIAILKEIDYYIRTQYNNLKTITTFETKEMGERRPDEIKNIRKVKKIAFNQHSGKIKISTIHSFKGYESPTVFLIVDEENEHIELDDNDEMVYTGITRAKQNLMVFIVQNSKYREFFAKNIKNLDLL